MTDKELKVKLDDVTRTLEKLSIKQTKLEEYIVNTRITVRGIKEILGSKLKPKQQLINRYNLKVNDIEEILNPSRIQHSEGKIIGITKDNLAEIQTDNRSVIRRITRNIKIQKMSTVISDNTTGGRYNNQRSSNNRNQGQPGR